MTYSEENVEYAAKTDEIAKIEYRLKGVTNKEVNYRTQGFAHWLYHLLDVKGFDTSEPFESGNIVDGPGWIIECVVGTPPMTMNIEIAGPAYDDEEEVATDE